jgi:ribosomal 50S subunit-recycling heat shock protein
MLFKSLYFVILASLLIARPASALIGPVKSCTTYPHAERSGNSNLCPPAERNSDSHIQAERSKTRLHAGSSPFTSGSSSSNSNSGRTRGATQSKRQAGAGRPAGRAAGTKATTNKTPAKQSDAGDGVRLNKCLLGLSRRAADDAIAGGRVSLNGQVLNSPDDPSGASSNAGRRVQKGDKVRLDGALQNWDTWNQAKEFKPSKKVRETL